MEVVELIVTVTLYSGGIREPEVLVILYSYTTSIKQTGLVCFWFVTASHLSRKRLLEFH